MRGKLGAFLRHHRRAEGAVEAMGMALAWRLLAATVLGAGVASAAVLTTESSAYHPSYVMSAKGLAFVERHEGVVLHPYNDAGGVCTEGAGHVLHFSRCTSAELRSTITPARADALLGADTGTAQACIRSRVTHPIDLPQYEALVDLAFNAGCGSLYYRNVIGLVNAGALGQVPYALSTTAVTAAGHYLAGLYQRRLDEGALFSKGYYGVGIGYYAPPRKLTAAERAEAKLRAKTGFYPWLAWYLHEGDWRAYAVHASVVRPNVPRKIGAAWWRRERAFVGARA